jgi:hypothetical protein
LTLQLNGTDFGVSPTKVDRSKLYGWTETVALDAGGNPCELALVDQIEEHFAWPVPPTVVGRDELATEVRISSSQEQLMLLTDELIASKVKSGWQLVTPGS